MMYRTCLRYFDELKGKAVKREYLVHAFSVTEAEAAMMKYAGTVINTPEVISAKKMEDVEVIDPVDVLRGDGKWYNISYTVSTGSGKKSRAQMMLCELSTSDAERKFKEIMKDSVFDFEVKKIEETKIYDLIE